MLSLADVGKMLALSSFVVAFPSVYLGVGKMEGLKVSFSILMLYLIRAIIQLVFEATILWRGSTDAQSLISLRQASRVFVFSEIPSLLLAGYWGLRYLPDWMMPGYEKVLLLGCPAIILVEGFAAMTIILSSGQLWSDIIYEASPTIKMVVIGSCIAVYGLCAALIITFYQGGPVTSMIWASLVAIFLTLIMILTIATIIVEHGTITDSALLFLYTTYNLWLITRSSVSRSINSLSGVGIKGDGTWWDRIRQLPRQFSIPMVVSPWHGLKDAFSATLDVFSVEIITILAVQMALLIIAFRWYQQNQTTRQQGILYWIVGVAWPALGRISLVAIYTYAWLSHANQNSVDALSWYLNPIIWRWINLFGCLAIYTYHLILPPNEGPEDEIKFHFD